MCANARLLLLCRLSIPIVSDRLTSVDIRRYTRTKNYLDGLDGAKRIINSLNSLSKVLSTYVTKPPLVPNLRPNSLTEKRAKQENYRFIVYQSCWAFVQQSPSFDFGLIARESRKNERTGFESVVGDPWSERGLHASRQSESFLHAITPFHGFKRKASTKCSIILDGQVHLFSIIRESFTFLNLVVKFNFSRTFRTEFA